MAEITIQKPGFDGAVITLAAATDTGDFATLTKDTGYEFRCTNGGGAPITVTFTAVQRSNQNQLNDQILTVTNATTESASIAYYSIDPTSDRFDITYSAVTTVTVAIVEV